jgi:hypothetical protein
LSHGKQLDRSTAILYYLITNKGKANDRYNEKSFIYDFYMSTYIYMSKGCHCHTIYQENSVKFWSNKGFSIKVIKVKWRRFHTIYLENVS